MANVADIADFIKNNAPSLMNKPNSQMLKAETIAIGQHILAEMYDADIAKYRSKGRKDISLRELEELLNKKVSRGTLANAVQAGFAVLNMEAVYAEKLNVGELQTIGKDLTDVQIRTVTDHLFKKFDGEKKPPGHEIRSAVNCMKWGEAHWADYVADKKPEPPDSLLPSPSEFDATVAAVIDPINAKSLWAMYEAAELDDLWGLMQTLFDDDLFKLRYRLGQIHRVADRTLRLAKGTKWFICPKTGRVHKWGPIDGDGNQTCDDCQYVWDHVVDKLSADWATGGQMADEQDAKGNRVPPPLFDPDVKREVLTRADGELHIDVQDVALTAAQPDSGYKLVLQVIHKPGTLATWAVPETKVRYLDGTLADVEERSKDLAERFLGSRSNGVVQLQSDGVVVAQWKRKGSSTELKKASRKPIPPIG